jgi:hypothetical protein
MLLHHFPDYFILHDVTPLSDKMVTIHVVTPLPDYFVIHTVTLFFANLIDLHAATSNSTIPAKIHVDTPSILPALLSFHVETLLFCHFRCYLSMLKH